MIPLDQFMLLWVTILQNLGIIIKLSQKIKKLKNYGGGNQYVSWSA